MTTNPYSPGWAGPVRVYAKKYLRVRNGGRPAYTKREAEAIIRQGKDRPRPLTHEQLSLANRNQRQARGDLDAMETWYATQCRTNGAKRRGRAG